MDQTIVSNLNAYRVKQKVANRILTVELPADFEDVDVEVVVLKEITPAAGNKEEKLEIIRRMAGIYKPGDYVLPEDEWYKQ